MKKRLLSILLVICMIVPLVPTRTMGQVEADAKTDAFGIKTEGDFNSEEKAEAKKANPYGTDDWYPLVMVSELFVAKGHSDNRYFHTYNYNKDGEEGSIGNVTNAKYVGKDEGNKDGFSMMDTVACDPKGEGQDKYVANIAYWRDKKQLQVFLSDASGNRIGGEITIGGKDNLGYLKDLGPYQNSGFISITAGDYDGDGKDSIIAYIAEMEDGTPHIVQYDWDTKENKLKETRKLIDNVHTKLLGTSDLHNKDSKDGKVRRNAPLVQLVTADTDKDNVDELVITAGLSNTNSSESKVHTQMFIYDYEKKAGEESKSWNQTYRLETNDYDNKNARIRFGSSAVGNLILNNNSGETDFPEILTAGWVDTNKGSGLEHNNNIGAYVTSCEVKNGKIVYSSQQVEKKMSSEFSYGGHKKDDIQDLVPVGVFLADGVGSKAYAVLADTVYSLTTTGGSNYSWGEKVFRDSYFDDDDDGIGGSIISNGLVCDMVTGNFDGNEAGREQVIFSTIQKRQSRNQYWITIYTYQKDKNGNWKKDSTGHTIGKKGNAFVSLCPVDTDNDSIIVRIKDVERSYTEPEVLAILEATPYFAEVEGGDIGNSATAYGKTKGNTTGTSSAHGLTTQIIAGFELEELGCGGGFETSIENNFTWETTESLTTEYTLEWANDTQDNMVIVYRRPVTTWKYEVKGKDTDILLAQEGDLLTSMITVEEYNEGAEQYDLNPISDSMLAEPGNPFSYRSSTAGLADVAASTNKSQYQGLGTLTQSITTTKETESTFTYDLSASFVAYGMVFGVKAGGGLGYTFSESNSKIDTESISKSGAVTCISEEGYDFYWKFAHWTIKLKGDTKVPVLGYVLDTVTAPPSPPKELNTTSTKNSVTLHWEVGERAADEYRIYQIYSDGTMMQIGAVDGTEKEWTIGGLKPNTTYTYAMTGYSGSGTCKGESVLSEEVKATTLPDGEADVTITDPKNIDAVIGENAKFETEIYVYSEDDDYKGVNYQWQKREKGGNWEDIDDANRSTYTVENVQKEDSGTEYRCVFKVSYASSAAIIRYYSEAAKLTVGKKTVHPTLTITGHDNTGTGSVENPYKGKSDYVTETSTQSKTTKTVNVVIAKTEKHPALTVYQTGSGSDLTYYGIGVEQDDETEKTVYYTVEKKNNTYTAKDKITEKETISYVDKDGKPVTLPTFDLDKQVTADQDVAGKPITCYLFADVEGTIVNPSDDEETRLEKATKYTLYWYGNGNYYSYSDGKVGTAVTDENKIDALKNKKLYGVFSYDKKEVTTEGTPEGTTIAEPATAYTEEKLVLGREETWTEETETRNEFMITYLYNKIVNDQPNITLQVISVKNTLSYSYGEGEEKTIIEGFNPAFWTVVTEEKEEEITTTTYNTTTGDNLTLSTLVNDGDGDPEKDVRVDFTIVNTQSNGITTLSAVTGEDGKATVNWGAGAKGLYSIQVTVNGTSANTNSKMSYAKTETEKQYYQAEYTYSDEITEYRLDITKDGKDALGNVSYGDTVNVSLHKREIGEGNTAGDWTVPDAADKFTYYYKKADDKTEKKLTGAVALDAGNYVFYAKDENQANIASAALTVKKLAITLTPTWTITPETANGVTIQVTKTGTKENLTLAGIKDFISISCSYFGLSDSDKKAANGRYDVVLGYKDVTDAAIKKAQTAFKNNYSVTFETEHFIKTAGTAKIIFSSGENGTIKGFYDELYYPLTSGNTVKEGVRIRFAANPKSGYGVDRWVINGTEYDLDAKNLPENMSYSADGKFLYVSAFNIDKHVTAGALDVKVTFKSVSNAITYGVSGDNGTLTAETKDGKQVVNGTKVSNGSTLIFKATPAAGYCVDSWKINGNDHYWDNTEEKYTGNTLTLENIQKDQSVIVTFKEITAKQGFIVSANAADEEGNQNDSLAVISAANAETKETLDLSNKVPQGTSITFTANVPETANNTVKEWQISKGNQGFETVKGSGGSDTFTLYNVEADTKVRVIITKAQSFQLNYDINWDGDATAEELEGLKTSLKASLKASSNNAALADGEAQSAYIPVLFELSLKEDWNHDNYYVEGWKWSSNVTEDKKDSKKATLDSLDQDTTVGVTITLKKKTGVTYKVASESATGTLQAYQGEKAEASFYFASGTALKPGTKVTFKAVPSTEYRVEKWTVKRGTKAAEIVKEDGLTFNGETLTLEQGKEDLHVEVTYVLRGNKITVEANEGGMITSVVAGNVEQLENIANGFTLAENATLTVKAAAKDGYVLDRWEINGTTVTEGEKKTIFTGDTLTYKGDNTSVGANIQVFFKATPKVSFKQPEHGTLEAVVKGAEGTQDRVLKDGDTVVTGTEVTFTVKPELGYKIKTWKVDDKEVSDTEGKSTFTYEVDKAVSVSVELEETLHNITLVKPSYGTVTVKEQEGTQQENGDMVYQVPYDGSITFTAKAKEYREIKGWKVDGKEAVDGVSQDKTTLTLSNITKDQTVEVQFMEAVYYEVDFDVVGLDSSNAMGSLKVETDGNFQKADPKEDATPSTGKEFTIAEDKKSLTAKAGNVAAVRVEGGSKLTLTATPAQNESKTEDLYMVENWYIWDENAGAYKKVEDNFSKKFTLDKLTKNTKIRVVFTDYVGYEIPVDGNGYKVTDVARTPDDTAPLTEVRRDGSLSFTLSLDKKNGFNMFSKFVVNNYDCLTDKLIDEEETVTGCKAFKSEKQEDGSYRITIEGITALNVEVDAHILKKVERKEATCIEEGNIEYWLCEDENCTNTSKKFADEKAQTPLRDGEEILAVDLVNGHDYSKAKAEFTWSADHKTADASLTCDLCHTEKKELTCTVSITGGNGKITYEATAKDGDRTFTDTYVRDHVLTKTESKAATCVAEGNIEYWSCTDKDCPLGMKNYADALGNQELKAGEEILPVDTENGHDYSTSQVSFQWTKDGKATAYVTCGLCGNKKNVDCKVVKEEGIGVATLTATATFQGVTYTSKKTIKITNAWENTVLRLQGTASKKSIKIKWNAVPGADGYMIYGRACGKTPMKQLKQIKNGKTITWTQKSLKAGTGYRYYVRAYKIVGGKKVVIKNSNYIHLITTSKKYTNVKSLKVSKSAISLKKGKTKKITVKQTYVEKKKKLVPHMKVLTYTTSNAKVATVTSKGKIKAKKKGTCYIYITACSGAYTRVKVTVK